MKEKKKVYFQISILDIERYSKRAILDKKTYHSFQTKKNLNAF